MATLQLAVTHSHWRSDEERRRYVWGAIQHYLQSTTGRTPDPDVAFGMYLHYEENFRRSEEKRKEDAENQQILRDLGELAGEMTRLDAQRLIGTDPRKYPLIMMHAAMGAKFGPFVQHVVELLPIVGQAVGVIEAILGQTVVTGEELSTSERALTLALSIIPEARGLWRAGKALTAIAAISRQSGHSARELYQLLLGLVESSEADLRKALAAVKKTSRLADEERKALEEALRTLRNDKVARVYGDELPESTRLALGDDPTVGRMHVRSAQEAGVTGRPTPRQSEELAEDMYRTFGLEPQVSLKAGKKVAYATRGSIRPDLYSKALRLSVDVKNYGIETTKGQERLLRNIADQVEARVHHLPQGTQQAVIVETRGQALVEETLDVIASLIVNRTRGLVRRENIYFIRE
jgi:hypothetical protein